MWSLYVVLITTGSAAVYGQERGLTLQPVIHVSIDRPELAHAEPHLAIDPANPDHMLAGVITLPDGGTSTISVLHSFDGGMHWRRDTLPRMSERWGADPWVAFDADGGVAIVVLAGPAAPSGDGPATLWYYKADSLGAPWRDPVEIGIGDGRGWDHERVAIDRSGGRYHGRAYVIGDKWGPNTARGTRTSSIGVALVDNDGGVTRIHHVEANNTSKSASVPIILRDGTVVFAFHEYLPLSQRVRERWIGGLWITLSEDGGATFGPRNFIAKGLPPGQISLVADLRNNRERLHAVWGTSGELRTAWSDNRGDRWSPHAVVGGYTGSAVLGTTAAVDGQGRIGILWNNETDGPPGQQCHEMRFSWSNPGDELAFTSFAIGTGPSCVPAEGGPTFVVGEFVNKAYERYGQGGDYYGLVGLPDGGFMAMWVDATTGELQMMARPVRPDVP